MLKPSLKMFLSLIYNELSVDITNGFFIDRLGKKTVFKQQFMILHQLKIVLSVLILITNNFLQYKDFLSGQ